MMKWRIFGRKTIPAFVQVGMVLPTCLSLDVAIGLLGIALTTLALGAELNIEFALDGDDGGGIRQGNK